MTVSFTAGTKTWLCDEFQANLPHHHPRLRTWR